MMHGGVLVVALVNVIPADAIAQAWSWPVLANHSFDE